MLQALSGAGDVLMDWGEVVRFPERFPLPERAKRLERHASYALDSMNRARPDSITTRALKEQGAYSLGDSGLQCSLGLLSLLRTDKN